MALIISLGSNLGDRREHLKEARRRLSLRWQLVAESQTYESPAVDYEQQPDFINQVLQFALPWETPHSALAFALEVEKSLGRERLIPRGPRTIDIDILFWGLETLRTPSLVVPHERWHERSFVVRPLSELPFFHAIEKCFTIPKAFTTDARPY